MKIIDAHMHFSQIAAFYAAADESKVDYSARGYLSEAAEFNIVTSVCMGLEESARGAFPDANAPAAMDANLEAARPSQIKVCLGINPHKISDASIAKTKQQIKESPDIAGFKIYAGYYHFMVHDPIYSPIYRLAAEHGLTVAIHTGDTYSEAGLLEYSHPLAADRLAVTFRDVNFVLCHMGDPWIMDACEVAYKNRNVFVDISGLLAGDEALISKTEADARVMPHYIQGLAYLNNYKKVLFGTDWPLVPMGRYIEFCKKLVPPHTYEDVFYNNAAALFNL